MRRLLGLAVLASFAAPGELTSADRDIVKAAERVRPAVVTVITENKRDYNLTGVVMTARGAILTLRKPLLVNNRIPARVKVRFPGKGKWVEAKVTDDDPVSNTALLEVSKMTTRPIQTRRSDGVRLGQMILLLGNSFGAAAEGTPTTSLGVVSGIVKDGGTVLAFHASTLVNPGSGGAPVADTTGAMIGLACVWSKKTASGGQAIVIPFDFIRQRYRKLDRRGALVFASASRRRGKSNRITDAFGAVVADAAKKAAPAVVGVRSEKLDTDKPVPPVIVKGRRRFLNPILPPVPGALPGWDRSSGVVVDGAKGWIVCPLRVTGWPGAERKLTVDTKDGRVFPAKILGKDERLRLALLQVEARDLETLEDLGRRSVRAGQIAIAIGFPHENPRLQTHQVTAGIVSRVGALARVHPLFQAVQTDAAVSGGNRGGALVDIDGRLIGMLLDVNDTNAQGYRTQRRGAYAGNAGLGFAVPMHVIRALAPRLAKGAVFRTGFLGVTAVPAPEGLRVTRVTTENSKKKPTTAAAAGLVKDDILVRIGATKLRGRGDLQKALALVSVGDKVEIEFLRAGQRKVVTVEMRER